MIVFGDPALSVVVHGISEKGVNPRDMMKRISMVTIFLFFVAGTLTGVRAVEEQKGPRIEFQQDRFDIGTLKQGEAAVHVFEFKNAGDEVLVINKVETS